MFDPRTRSLIQEAPPLDELDLERLPEEFTKAFAAIVAFRIRLAGGGEAGIPDELLENLEGFRRIAATYESMVALLPELEGRRSAAFVAAQAHHLLFLGHRASGARDAGENPLGVDSISPLVSALLLFLVANQPSDAIEMARLVAEFRPVGEIPSSLALDALVALAEGDLRNIPPLVGRSVLDRSADSGLVAAELLYYRILSALGALSDSLLSPTGDRGNLVITQLREVQSLAVQYEPWPFEPTSEGVNFQPLSTFSGPNHLATLLISATEFLTGCALASIDVPPGIDPSEWYSLMAPISHQRPFLWSNHLQAIDRGLLVPGNSAVVSFPTGAGKSTLSELKIACALGMDGPAIYLAPTHALVDQVKNDLREAFPNCEVRDSLLVDDFYAEIDEDVDSVGPQIVVMTPERCLALLSIDGSKFKSVRLIVFDECHLIHPQKTGQNRRSIDAMLVVLHLSQLAPSADWLLLSAMMANADEIAAWIAELTTRQCLALPLDWKPTRQARGCLVYSQTELEKLRTNLANQARASFQAEGRLRAPGVAVKRNVLAKPFGFFCLQQTWDTKATHDYTLLPLLDAAVPLSASKGGGTWYPTPNKNIVGAALAAQCVRVGLKVLLFVQNTTHVDGIVREISNTLDSSKSTPNYSALELELLNTATEEMGALESVLAPSIHAGGHHGLMLPVERHLVESFFRRGNGCSALVATPTLAQGVNLPADIVFIVGDERFDKGSNKSEPLEAHELLNAAGRAGRAGHVAQGLVLVLPHTLVDIDVENRKISKKWLELQKSVFSLADQCLSIEDPISHVIDRIHDEASSDDSKYLLRRIPRDTTVDEGVSRRFLSSTFGGWKARKSNQEEVFERSVEKILASLEQTDPAAGDISWRDELACRTGISVDLITALDRELARLAGEFPSTTEGWVRWYFEWLSIHPDHMGSVFGHRIPTELKKELDDQQGDLFGGKLCDVVWAWMSAEPLILLNTRLGGKPKNPGWCKEARKFVLRLVPNLAFAAGLAAQVRRKQLDEGASGDMPITLATFALCLREGVSDPELAALRQLLPDKNLSRAHLRRIWERIAEHTPIRSDVESFGKTRERVKSGLEHLSE